MYEDQPQELVHDLISEAIFGTHPLGRPVIGTRGGDLVVSGGASPPTTGRCTSPATSSWRPPETSSTSELLRAARRRRRRPSSAARRARTSGRRSCKAPPPGLRFQRKDTEQYHVCLAAPGIARSDRRRFAASLLDGILGGSASSRLFQEIREKRGMAYAVYSFASQYTDTGQIGIYVGTREDNLAPCLEIAREQIARHRRRQPPARGARAREGEPEGPDHALDGVDVEPDEPARQVADHRHRAALDRADHRRDRRRRAPRRSPSSRACCSRRRSSPPPGSGRTRIASWPRSSASTRARARAA